MNTTHYIKKINLYLCENFKVGRYASLLSKTPSLAAIRSQNRSSQPRIVHPLHQIQSKRSRSTAHAKLNRHNPRHSSSHVNPQLRSGLTLNRTIHAAYCSIANPIKERVITARRSQAHSDQLKFLNGKANGLNPDYNDLPRRR